MVKLLSSCRSLLLFCCFSFLGFSVMGMEVSDHKAKSSGESPPDRMNFLHGVNSKNFVSLDWGVNEITLKSSHLNEWLKPSKPRYMNMEPFWSPKDENATINGPVFSIGIGIAYSSHAASYKKVERFQTKDFGGFRANVLESKLGWGFLNKLMLYGVAKYSPSNTTISPYRSLYFGLGLNYFIQTNGGWYAHAGWGKLKSNIKDIAQGAGKGNLLVAGLGNEFAQHFVFELSVLTGSMEEAVINDVRLNSKEFSLQLTFNYLFY